MRIFVGVLRVSTILAFAVLTTAAARAQGHHDENDASSRASCADVEPPAFDPADTVDNVPLYIIPPGPSGHRAICRATEALAEGMVDVELSDDVVLSEALGGADTVTGEISKFPYSEPGSSPTPGLAPPGPAPERRERSHTQAAFVDPHTGVEYTFSSVADNPEDAEKAALDWISSTVEPLLENTASNASELARTDAAAFVTANAADTAANVADAAVNVTDPPPDYTSRAWTLLLVETIRTPNNAFVGALAHDEERSAGISGAVVKFYRLNANKVDSDFFLVDTTYTQTPSYDPFSGFLYNAIYWANKQTRFKLGAIDPYHPSITPSLLQFAPQTVVSSSDQTFSVGATLSADLDGPSGDLTANYSVTRNQLDVETVVRATVGDSNLVWTDTYNGFADSGGTYPATSINTFTGERLAVFKVPAAVNNVAPKVWAGLEFTPFLGSEIQGYFTEFFTGAHKNFEYANWQISATVFVPEPRFSVHRVPKGAPIYPQGSPEPLVDPDGPPLAISLSANNVANPVLVDVVAQLPNNAEKVTWRAITPSGNFVATDVGPSRAGSARIKIYPAPGAAVTNSGTIFFDSVPTRATNSLRNGSISVPVVITP